MRVTEIIITAEAVVGRFLAPGPDTEVESTQQVKSGGATRFCALKVPFQVSNCPGFTKDNRIIPSRARPREAETPQVRVQQCIR
jgi:hypothetical protein